MAQAQQTLDSLKTRLAQRAEQTAAQVDKPKSPAQTIKEYLDRMAPEIRRALPKHMDPDRLLRVSLTVIRTNPMLLECTVPSLLAAVMQAAQLGLEPGLLGHCYFVPFRNGKTGQMEVQFIIGYRGMIDLARRSGNIQSVYAQIVYANDLFRLKYGLEEELTHVPWHLREDQTQTEPGKIRGAYMVAKFKDGGHYIHYMPIAEIEEHRKRSKSADRGPWVTDYEEMCKKTVVRAGWKWLPISIEHMRAVAADETVKAEPTPDDGEVLDATFTVVDDGGEAPGGAGAEGTPTAGEVNHG
jgi:recombination protein RecT